MLRPTGAAVMVALAAGLVLLGGPALAHVSADPDVARDRHVKTDFIVGHGCGDSPTTAVRVSVPEGVEDPRPQPVAGWEIEVGGAESAQRGAVRLAHDGDDREHDDEADGQEDGEPAERVTEVAWVGGELPGTHVEEFGLSFRIAEDAPEVLYFPLVQECAEGEHRWTEVPSSHEEWDTLESPAPFVRVALDGDEEQPAADEGEEAAGGAPATVDGAPVALESSAEGKGTDPLTYLALGLAALGVALGLASMARRS